jgi:signal transduction histidine kinase
LRARTIRLRLTLTYGTVFLLTGGALLTIGYLLVRSNLNNNGLDAEARRILGFHPPRGTVAVGAYADTLIHAVRAQLVADALHRLLFEYIGALVVMTGVSVGTGWLLAGRVLAPLRAITATAQRVSGENLGERIDLVGPADELKDLADTFDGMLARLGSAFSSQHRFVANASHELRTPLAIMRTEVDVALADPDATAADLRDMGEALRETIDRSEALIAALLALARSGTVTVREQLVDVAALAGDVITDLHARAESAQVTIEDDLRPAVVAGDPALLERLLANLIDNGSRHNEAGGYLRVSTWTQDGRVSIRVRNGGPVIDPTQVQSLTEPFRRLNRQTAGFGLGLSIVSSVVEAHRGELTVKAPEGGGLEVVATFAAARSAGDVAAPRRHRALTKN